MPIRSPQQILEDKSRFKFQEILPERWVFRDKNKDYGIDAEVELFGEDGRPQGLIFYVQLKATSSKNESTILNLDLKIETLKYYKTLDIPVLLVRYSEYNDTFFHKWINNIDFYYAKKNAKTIRIKLTKDDAWKDTIPAEIEDQLKKLRKLKSGSFGFPLPISISINSERIKGISKGILMIQIKKDLERYSSFVTIEKDSKSLVKISLDKEELKISLSNIAGSIFHNVDAREKASLSADISSDILLGIAISMIKLEKTEYCGRIIFENGLEKRLIENSDSVILLVLVPLFYTSYYEEVLNLLDKIPDNKNFKILKAILNFHGLNATQISNSKNDLALENFLKKQIEKSTRINDEQKIGITHYNLGNYYSGRNQLIEAIHYFNLARKFAPLYLQQPHYFTEIGSVLFRTGKYKHAAGCYKKSLELKFTPHILALYADALLFSGEYEQSKEQFDEYHRLSENPADEFILKSILLRILLDNFNIKHQVRQQDEANKFADVNNADANFKSTLEKALTKDLLCNLAWFNLGILHNEEKEFDDATICFTMAGLIKTGDIESWKNATISCIFSKKLLYLLGLIVNVAFYFNKEDYLIDLYKQIDIQTDSRTTNLFSEAVEKILDNTQKQKKTTIRLLNKDGKFESLDDIIGKNEDE